ncbi:uncharacterized protein BDZ99DRAFT_112219 [Mytilinidion resinicola]|uniref:Uncharacterized protein n=1 Tax=Mytilinidion resinicola TaxID=574789 RepID=A0A6A6Y8U9_9PEZI|nr:uncharacterized protein BDZ99DRAFT_112219 [Mytilinidion resinicola]KAF2805059.1 hypothetical protein BDZ99DRAFT_112219 [Mytilinidion resinicola]
MSGPHSQELNYRIFDNKAPCRTNIIQKTDLFRTTTSKIIRDSNYSYEAIVQALTSASIPLLGMELLRVGHPECSYASPPMLAVNLRIVSTCPISQFLCFLYVSKSKISITAGVIYYNGSEFCKLVPESLCLVSSVIPQISCLSVVAFEVCYQCSSKAGFEMDEFRIPGTFTASF